MPPKTWPAFLLHCAPRSIPWSFVSLRLAMDWNEVSWNPTSWLSQRVARNPLSFHDNCSGKTQGITYKGRNKILTILVPNSLAGTVTEPSLGISVLSLSPWEVIPKYFPWLKTVTYRCFQSGKHLFQWAFTFQKLWVNQQNCQSPKYLEPPQIPLILLMASI